jgi:hypothetical protein
VIAEALTVMGARAWQVEQAADLLAAAIVTPTAAPAAARPGAATAAS